MSLREKYLPAALALALAIAIAGCGSSGEEATGGETTAASSPTKAQFVKKANAICRKHQQEIPKLYEAIWKKLGPPRSYVSQAKLNKVSLATLPPKVKEVRLLRALEPPQEDEAYIDRMLTSWEEAIEKGRKNPAVLRGSPKVEFAFQKSYDMGIAYGLVDCWLS